jgi:hypothetical protein
LLGKLRNSDGTERVSATAGQRSEADHEEMKTREGNHVDGQLAEIRVELAWEAQASCDTGHDCGDEMVEVAIRWVVKLECPHADIVESLVMLAELSRNQGALNNDLVVNAEGLIRVLDQLMDGECGVVGLDNGVGDLGGWDDGEGGHHAIGEFLADLGDKESSHTGTGTSTEGVGDLETLEAVAALGLTTHDIENLVDEFGTLSVMALSPVVTGTGLTEDEVVGAEELAEGTSTDGVHGTWLEIDEDGTGNELVARRLKNALEE